MRALVTGATGFVGSHLVEALAERGATVAVLARPSSNRGRLGRVRPAPAWIVGDLHDPSSSRKSVAEFAPDVVFHLAWAGVGRTGRDDRSQIESNLAGTLALFDLAVSVGCRSFVGLGSQAEYGPHDGIIDENTPLNPTSLYGAAKASACLLLTRLAANAGVRFAWLRLFSAYGPGDHPQALIPFLIRSLLDGKTPTLSSGSQPWDYLYVTDAADAIAGAGCSPEATGVYNLASGQFVTIRSVAERLRDMTDPGASLEFGEARSPGIQADISRLGSAIGWKPRIGLEVGLQCTIESVRGDGRSLSLQRSRTTRSVEDGVPTQSLGTRSFSDRQMVGTEANLS
ncbi:MAG: Nucleoside-diphosphate-sugar epimerase [Planctomycetota bacterium]|nr:Nucleoside-diphosphate-sugar epimerase [Planctomycetota bacterium]